ncbi:MAG: DNA cytosine methyltransferase [Gammaproteobacteria bacterium]|nr:DNA cytosine methyltransferase [Gammaproteobacteria bacterium]
MGRPRSRRGTPPRPGARASAREMARLHGFADWPRFHVTKWHGARQTGNSVPPPFARVVAASSSNRSGWHPPAQPVRPRLARPIYSAWT